MLVNSYNFSAEVGIQEVMHFIAELNSYIAPNNPILTTDQMQQNFSNIVNNLYKLQQYLGIDEQWSLPYPPCRDKLDIMSVQNTKFAIQKILTKSILHKRYKNIIFEFHRYQPFTVIIQQIYTLLINALLDIKPSLGIDTKVVLSLYLTHASVYNNTSAIKLLIEQYHVSPIVTWSTLPIKYAYAALTVMPLLLTVNIKAFQDNQKFFTVSFEEQQANFMLMLRQVNFSQMHINLLQIQQIFRCAFENTLVHVIDYLLEQIEFCERIHFSEEDIIMMAVSTVVLPQYQAIVDNILHNQHLSKNTNINLDEIKKQIEQYVYILKNIDDNLSNQEQTASNQQILKITLKFVQTFLAKNPENNNMSEILFITTRELDNIRQEKQALLLENSKLQENIAALEQEIDKLRVNLSASQQQNEELVHKQELLLNKFNNYKRCYNCLNLFTPPESPATSPGQLNSYLKLQFASPN